MRVFPPDDGTGSGAMAPVPGVSAGVSAGTPTPLAYSLGLVLFIVGTVFMVLIILKAKPLQ